ncbi:MAG: DUF3754 domain-containing protein [Gemmataceae bacterium]
MAEYADREHYIPLRKSDLVELLCRDQRLGANERDGFRQFCRLVSAVWHFEYLETLERIKDLYAPFDPDAVTRPLTPLPPEQRPARMEALFDEFTRLMEKANFKRLTRQDVEAAVEGGASDWGVNMYVDWKVFERIEVFTRSEGKTTRTKRHWLFFWREISKEVDTYRRLVLLVKLRKSKRIPPTIDTDDVFAKMFKDIPKLDLEMTLPGTLMQMPLWQKFKLGGSAVGTIGYGLYSLGAKLVIAVYSLFAAAATFAVSAVEYALFAPFFVLFGYGYKQFYSYQVTKQQYAKRLAESLYYQSLDNDLGVITQVLDEAEEQECRETILAYYYLWKYAPPEGWEKGQLDDYVEPGIGRQARHEGGLRDRGRPGQAGAPPSRVEVGHPLPGRRPGEGAGAAGLPLGQLLPVQPR